jgi:hypothetical protein
MRLKVLLGVCVLLGGWMAKGVVLHHPVEASAPTPVAASPAPEPVTEAAPDIAAVQAVDPPLPASHSSRNLFSYHEAPPAPTPVAEPVAAAPPVEIAAVAPLPPAEPAEPVIPPFPWRYIGRFGRANDQVAAFVRDGQVKTVRGGDRIDEQYVLRTIGIETVEVESEAAGTEQIALAVNEPMAAVPPAVRPPSNPNRKRNSAPHKNP